MKKGLDFTVHVTKKKTFIHYITSNAKVKSEKNSLKDRILTPAAYQKAAPFYLFIYF